MCFRLTGNENGTSSHMYRHYGRAPISEAIIDLRAAIPDSADLKIFTSFADALRDRFPIRKAITTLMMGFHKANDEAEATFKSGQEQVGVRLDSANGQRVLQVQRAGFTYSHMPPYSDWKTFRSEARELWARYLECTGVSQVTRLAVRVINKLGVTASMDDLPRYSNLRLQLPTALHAPPYAFFTQFQLSGAHWAEGCRAVVNAGAAPQPDGKLELLWDFDIFVETAKEASSAEIWEILDRQSDAKDQLFEACITDATRELIA